MSFFPPPAPIEAKIFSRLPDRFRAAKRSAWADANKGGEAIDSFLEGPSFAANGDLIVTDIPHGRVFRVDRGGTWSQIAGYEGWPNGLKVESATTALIADYRHGLMRLDLSDGTVTPVLQTLKSESFKGLNDLHLGPDGAVYITDQGQTGMHDPTGRVFRRDAGGRIERLLATCPSPNGLCLDAAGTSLFVAMTRACQIWRVPLWADGVVAKVGVFCHTPGGLSGPDGIAALTDGGLVVANPGHGRLWVLDRFGVPTHVVASPAGRTVTNLAFDPLEPNRLVATESETGALIEARLPVAGVVLAPAA